MLGESLLEIGMVEDREQCVEGSGAFAEGIESGLFEGSRICISFLDCLEAPFVLSVFCVLMLE